MAIVLLIRHGENDWVKKNRLAGWLPGIQLNDVGRNQAANLARRLKEIPLTAIYSSPLERCLETAAPVADVHQLATIELADIGEVRYGKWQGKKLKKLSKKSKWHTVQHFPSRMRFPSGESFNEAQFRAVAAIEQLAKVHQREIIATISHSDIIKLILAHYIGMPIDSFQRLTISPASVSAVALMSNGRPYILRVNDTGEIPVPHFSSEQSGDHVEEEE